MIIALYIAAAIIMAVGSLYFAWRNRDFRKFLAGAFFVSSGIMFYLYLADVRKNHWIHLRTTNPVESPFSAVRLRTDAARRYKKVANAEALIWKILMIAEKKFRRLNAPELLAAVYDGQLFEDGMPVNETNPKRRAA